jgi:Flp pilus assembly pilin Flp
LCGWSLSPQNAQPVWRTSRRRGHTNEAFKMKNTLRDIAHFLADDQGQDIAEYAVMLAVILVIVVGTIRLIGSNANSVFSQAASSIQ